MKSIVIATAAAAALCGSGAANADAALARKSGCMTCHAVDATKEGPSFKSTAAKYKGQADAEKKILDQFKSNADHAKVKSNGAETATLVKWILAM